MIKNNLQFEVFGNTNLIETKKPICITFGNFDGVHLGHKYLIESMRLLSKEIPIVVVTFYPHSSNFFSPQNQKPLLINMEDKIYWLLKCGADAVIVQKFDENFASLTADNFCENWLHTNFNVHSIILGHDFCYGKNRQGNIHHMEQFGKKYGWLISQIDAHKISITNNKPISSSLIRQEILLGNMDNVENLLGRLYILSGVVARGDQRGRTIGFPTANLKLSCNYTIPKYGVYACYVEIEGFPNSTLLPAVMNCGIRPTVGEGLKLQIEAHILNFNEDIYDNKIQFHIKKYIRNEIKFTQLDQLKKQIQLDIDEAIKIFATK